MEIYKDSNDQWRMGEHTNPGPCGFTKEGDKVRIFAHGNDKRFWIGKFTEIEFKVNGEFVACTDEADFRTKAKDVDFFVDSDTILETINQSILGGGGTTLRAIEVELTRPANTTVYSPNDVVADTTAAFKPFLNVAKANGYGVKIVRVRIQTEDTGVTGTKFNLHVYKEAPTFIADNAAFAVSYANASKRVGAIPVVMGTGNLNTVGMNDYNQVILNPTSKDVYFILETVSGFTPSANSTKFTVVIDCELSN
jgi:hypothetical protein